MRLDRSGYEVDFFDSFERAELDRSRWLPAYLPQWSNRAQSRRGTNNGTANSRF